MSRRVLQTMVVVALVLSVAPAAFADSFTPGWPCKAERTTYYSSAAHTTVVGYDEYICDEGHSVTGERSAYSTYQYLGACCHAGACKYGQCGGLEPFQFGSEGSGWLESLSKVCASGTLTTPQLPLSQ